MTPEGELFKKARCDGEVNTLHDSSALKRPIPALSSISALLLCMILFMRSKIRPSSDDRTALKSAGLMGAIPLLLVEKIPSSDTLRSLPSLVSVPKWASNLSKAASPMKNLVVVFLGISAFVIFFGSRARKPTPRTALPTLICSNHKEGPFNSPLKITRMTRRTRNLPLEQIRAKAEFMMNEAYEGAFKVDDRIPIVNGMENVALMNLENGDDGARDEFEHWLLYRSADEIPWVYNLEDVRQSLDRTDEWEDSVVRYGPFACHYAAPARTSSLNPQELGLDCNIFDPLDRVGNVEYVGTDNLVSTFREGMMPPELAERLKPLGSEVMKELQREVKKAAKQQGK